MTVVGVHGIAQEQLGPNQLVGGWARALEDGLELAARPAPPPAPPAFEMAYYGDLFLSETDQGVRVTKGPAKGSLENLDELSADEMAFLNDVGAEIPVDERAPGKGFVAVPDVLLPMTRRLCRRFDGWLVLALVSELVQVHRYLADDDLAEQIRARVLEKITPGCQMLVGHSLGSVVAFETLALHPELDVGTLITAGSPLSMRTVVSRLRAGAPRVDVGLPGGVRRWVNVYDKSDPVAGAGVVCRLWPDAEDFEVNNGDKPHSIAGYLSKRATGQVILGCIRGDDRP
jgi:hypothetical protein